MIETIIIAFIVSKFKGYDIKPLLKSWTIIPIILFEVTYMIGQALVFNENYQYIEVFVFMKPLYLCAYLFLVFKYEIYASAILGSVCVCVGGLLNDIAIKVNNGFMPAFPTLSYITGYVKPESFKIINDIHILGSSQTNMKILTDYIDLGYCILSIGDVLIRMFVFIILYSSIKKLNYKTKEGKLC